MKMRRKAVSFETAPMALPTLILMALAMKPALRMLRAAFALSSDKWDQEQGRMARQGGATTFRIVELLRLAEPFFLGIREYLGNPRWQPVGLRFTWRSHPALVTLAVRPCHTCVVVAADGSGLLHHTRSGRNQQTLFVSTRSCSTPAYGNMHVANSHVGAQ